MDRADTSQKGERIRIYTVGQLSKRDEVLASLRRQFHDVEFVDGGGVLNIEKLTELRSELDGVIVFGTYLSEGLGSLGLPVVMVKDLWSWEKGIRHFYRGRPILTAYLSYADISPSTSTARLNELSEKVGMIVALSRVKRSRLLDLTHREVIQPDDQRDATDDLYQRTYLDVLEASLGLQVVRLGFEELQVEVDENEAERIADLWIAEAEAVRDTTRENVVKSAKMYLSVLKLMKKYEANAVTMSGWTGFGDGKIDAFPCLGFTELSKRLVPNNCESLIDALVTEMLGIYIMGRPGFVGDTIVDPLNGVIIFGHCKCPINPHGDDRVPYVIRDHTGWPKGTGAAVDVRLPLNETVTAVKFSVYDRRMSVLTGTTVSGESMYKGFDDILCRTKLVVKTNTEAFMRNYDSGTFGIHKVVFFGDFRQKFIDLATLMGFEVVEEDR